MKLNKAILIDDMFLVRREWALSAKKFDIQFSAFSSVDEFLLSAEQYEMDIFIFVDRKLGNNKFGEIESKKLAAIGFLNIYLCTTLKTFSNLNLPHIKAIIETKIPPWEVE